MPAGVSAASRKRSSASSSTCIAYERCDQSGCPTPCVTRRRRVARRAPTRPCRCPGSRRTARSCTTAGVDAERVGDLRVDELPALVERAELLAEAVDGLAGREREAPRVQCPPWRTPAERTAAAVQPRKCSSVIDAGDGRAAMQEAKAQRRGGDLERRLARRERPGAAGPRATVHALVAADDEAVVGPGARSRAQPEHARTVARDFEDVAGRRRERRARRRRAERSAARRAAGRRSRRTACASAGRAGADTAHPANFGSGRPGTSTVIAKRPPDCGRRASSSSASRAGVRSVT